MAKTKDEKPERVIPPNSADIVTPYDTRGTTPAAFLQNSVASVDFGLGHQGDVDTPHNVKIEYQGDTRSPDGAEHVEASAEPLDTHTITAGATEEEQEEWLYRHDGDPSDGDTRTNVDGTVVEIYTDGEWHLQEGSLEEQAAGIGSTENEKTDGLVDADAANQPEGEAESQTDLRPSEVKGAVDALPEGWEEKDRNELLRLAEARGLDLPGNTSKVKAISALKKWERDQAS